MGKRTLRLTALAMAAVLMTTLCVFLAGCRPDHEDYPRSYSGYVAEAAREYGVEEALIYAVCKAESGFDPDATSPVGAIGLMQLMPDTCDWLMMREGTTDLQYNDFYDPRINIRYGTQSLAYIRELLGDVEISTIAAAYNAGPGYVQEWLKDPAHSSDGRTLKDIPFPETALYSAKVQSYYDMYKSLYY